MLVDSLVCHGQTFHVDEGNAINKGPQQTQPHLSGSVCRVNDALDFLNVSQSLDVWVHCCSSRSFLTVGLSCLH